MGLCGTDSGLESAHVDFGHLQERIAGGLAVALEVEAIADLGLAARGGSQVGSEAEGEDGSGDGGELHVVCWK